MIEEVLDSFLKKDDLINADIDMDDEHITELFE